MEKLLQWLIAQQSGDKEAMDKIGQPDPELLAQLFGQKADEPTLMKNAIAVVENPDATLDNKQIAFENFEMLIENMDNANNIENMHMWPAVLTQLREGADSLRVTAASVVGIAVQNNPKSQDDFCKYPEGVAVLVEYAQTKNELGLKSVFALASLIRNHEAAYQLFDKAGGWKVVDLAAAQPKTRLRVLSLVLAILSTGLTSEKTANIKQSNLVLALVEVFDSDHLGSIDKALHVISQLAQLNYLFSSEDIAQLAKGLDKIESLRESLSEDDFVSARQVCAST